MLGWLAVSEESPREPACWARLWRQKALLLLITDLKGLEEHFESAEALCFVCGLVVGQKLLPYVLYVHVRRQILLALHDIEAGLHLQFLLGVIFDKFLYLAIQCVDHVLVLLVDSEQFDKHLMEQVLDHSFDLYRDWVVLWWFHLVEKLLRLGYCGECTFVALMLGEDFLDCTR